MNKMNFVQDSLPYSIQVFKTHCKLPDGSVGEICKKMSTGWLVCNPLNWWICDTDWILENKIDEIG